jgi:polyhydroxybutyrate depolymerase
MRTTIGAALLLTATLFVLTARAQKGGATMTKEIEVGGMKRTYLLHVPASLPKGKKVPLVLVFHGGGGTAAYTERLTRFSDLADREGFLVVYPEGPGKNWYDGREFKGSLAHETKRDDVAYVAAVLDAVAKEHPVDPKRIYATGISNGGIFSHYLAAHLSGRIAAIAPVVGGMPDPFHKKFKPEKPVSVFIIQGTKDPLVPYDGGDIAQKRGKVLATDEAVKMWVKHNGCEAKPTTGELDDKDPRDGCRVKWATWGKGKDGTEVTLYTIEGGGHTWPDGPQYYPEAVIGKVCRDFNGTAAIWEFFKKHPKP